MYYDVEGKPLTRYNILQDHLSAGLAKAEGRRVEPLTPEVISRQATINIGIRARRPRKSEGVKSISVSNCTLHELELYYY